MKGTIVVLALMLAISMNAGAIRVSVPSEIVVQENRITTYFIVIENTSHQSKNLKLSYSAPTQNRILGVPAMIEAGRAARVQVELQPNPALTGSTYSASVNVKLGDEQAVRTSRLIFASGTGSKENLPGGLVVGSLFTPENAITIMLILIAAVLLVAFIARLVKRVAT